MLSRLRYGLDSLWQDTRFALRLMSRTRSISLTIVATLTIGIGLNVSVFTLLNALLLRPWVKTDPATFVSVIPRFSGEYARRFSDYGAMSQPDYAFYRDSTRSLESLAAYRPLNMTLSGADSGSIRGGLISCNLFDVMKSGPPIAGRYLLPDECGTASNPTAVAVLGENAWRARFAADPHVVGQLVHLNRVPVTIVGVAPDIGLTATAPTDQIDVWLPYTMLQVLRRDDEYFGDLRAQWLNVVGRRHREYSLAQVQQELAMLARRADERVPGRVTSLIVTDGSLVHDPEIRALAPLIFSITLGTTGLLLLIACVNVTTLLLARSAARQREIAVRMSLGAGRVRLLRQFVTEGLLLSGIAAVASVVIAQRAPAAIWYSVTSRAAPFALAPDRRVVLYCIGVALVAGTIAGLSPAADSLRPRVAESLKDSGAGITAGRGRVRFRNVLVGMQIALGLLLVVQVALFSRAQRRFFSYDPGFETRQVLTIALASVMQGLDPPAAFYRDLESRVNALPGVVRTSYASLAPWSGLNPTRIDAIDGQPIPPTRDFRQDPARRVVSPGYFAALEIPLIRGRAFSPNDRPSQGLPVPAVISEAMARRYWPGQDPIGRQFRVVAIHEIVGVCRDVQSVAYMRDDGPLYYAPIDIERSNPNYMLVRVAGDTRAVAGAVTEIVRQLDPQMAATVATLGSIVEREGERLRPLILYGVAAAVVALLLALSGVYAVVSFSVSQRVREIGIRMALGAQRRDVVLLVLRSALVPVIGGLIAGVGLATLAAAGTRSILFGVNARDPVTLTVLPLLLLGAAAIAVWIPARRAAALDPSTSLR